MSSANLRWSAPRLHGELQKLGIQLVQATVAKYMVRHRKPPSQTWRTFLENHAKELVSIDFLVVPTATFRLLVVFLVLSHDRRRLLHFGVTSHPTAAWTARALVQAAPRYLLRDRDRIYGEPFPGNCSFHGDSRGAHGSSFPVAKSLLRALQWLDPKGMSGPFHRVPRACLHRTLKSYFDYYERSRTHLSLDKDAPLTRAVHPPEMGRVIELPQVGGLHHRYERRAA
jgi:putative transposase